MDTSKHVVVCMISNPVRYESRYELYWKFKDHMEQSGAKLLTVEVALGSRPFQVTDASDPWNLQYRTWSELWHKENALNLGMSYLTNKLMPDVEYITWADADIEFTSKGMDGKPKWVSETVHALQHHMMIQPWSTAIDLSPTDDPLPTGPHRSFCYQYRQGAPYGRGYSFWHPGFCWSARREAIEYVAGLMDFACLGAGDHHMATALVGRGTMSVPERNLHVNYRNRVLAWQERAERYIRRDIGYVDGLILHRWHGRKADRRYVERWDILTGKLGGAPYDPNTDIMYRWDGVLEWSGSNQELIFNTHRYFRQRNEDSIDVE